MARNKSQLYAISRSYTKKARDNAKAELRLNYGIDFAIYCAMFQYKASPVRLLTDIKFMKESTWDNISAYRYYMMERS